MFRLIIIILLFVSSLLNFFPVPGKQIWYAGILIPEYPWIFIAVTILLLCLRAKNDKYKTPSLIIGSVTLIIFCSPVVRAYGVSSEIEEQFKTVFDVSDSDMKGFHELKPFSFIKMITGNGAKKIPFTTYHYATQGREVLTLNFSPSVTEGLRPCLLVVHGGSWTRGDNSEIAAVNNYFANAGYQVATINYRLAPEFHSPAQQEDVHAAIVWLKRHAAELKIDTGNFVLTGRSAGAQMVLTAAYNMPEPGIKGVAAFYGPTDMQWSYEHPDKLTIMDSRKVQRDFLGGTQEQVPDRYFAESPLMHVTEKTVPTLLIHGKLDAHVSYIQSVRLADRLNEKKVKNILVTLPWATHGCEYNLNGPSGQLSMYAMERFFYAVTRK